MNTSGSSHFQAQSFETGADTGGYTITEVQIRLRTVNSGNTTSVTIREDGSSAPGNLVATLMNSATLTGSALNTFTAPANTTLDAGTTYWISVSEGVSNRVTLATTAGNGETGWSIGNGRLWRASETSNWQSESANLVMVIKGSVVTTTVSDDATLSALTVNDGTNDLTLDPTFASGTYVYAADAGEAVDEVTLTATVNDDGAEVSGVTLGGTAIADSDFTDGITVPSLVEGDNVIVVTVTAEDTTTTQPYTITVTRATDISVIPFLWSLKPMGLRAGNKFRLVFLSSTTRNANPTNIATYDTFIQGLVAAGHDDIRAYSDDFHVVGCTEDTDARDHTETRHSSGDRGVPIYWLNGVKVADDYQEFYDGGWSDEIHEKNESGRNGLDSTQAPNYPWTGCKNNGTEKISGGVSRALGKSDVTVGRSGSIDTGAGPIGSNDTRQKASTRPMYGLSGVFQVQAPVTTSICGRTAKVQDKLLELIEDNKGSAVACADVTDAQLVAITVQIDLSDEGITAIAEGDFDGLTALENVRLDGNDLSTLPAGVFDELTELTDLTLASNDLSTLSAGVFDELTELTYLRLDGNDLSTLPAGVFDELTKLEELSLRNNGLTSLRADAFDALTALETLYIDTNELTALPAGVFDELTKLQDLLLYDNELSTLPDEVFEQLTALTQLSLFNNPGAPFSPTAVAVPDDGEVSTYGGDVTLDGTGSGGAWGTNVTYEWERPAPLKVVAPAPARRVTVDDKTSATPVATFPALPPDTEMTFTLTVTGRGGTIGISSGTDTAKVSVLLDVDAGICGRTAQLRDWLLLDIFYENNGVDVACANVTNDHLALLEDPIPLANEGISELAFGDFAGLSGVKELGLGGNNLTTLPGGVFLGLTALEKLGLGNNDLTSLPILAFYEMTTLKELQLHSNTNLTTLPQGVFNGLTSLEKLSLYDTGLTTLPPEVFDELTALKQLELVDTGLTTIPSGLFDGLTALEKLYIDSNELTTLPDGVFDDLTALKTLSMSNNNLATLSYGVFEQLTALTTLNLLGNPGAPFRPTADALHDDAIIPTAGSTVTLDGSGSGGPWGTNVTYLWALTIPDTGVTFTFDDDTSATTDVTIPALTEGTELTFTLTVTPRGGSLGTAAASDTAFVTARDAVPNATGRPAITGPAQVGMTLTAGTADIMDADGLTAPGYTYQWLKEGSDISGQTGSTYTQTSSDIGENIQVKVEFTDDATNTESLTSDETTAVVPAAITCPTPTTWCSMLTTGYGTPNSDDEFALGLGTTVGTPSESFGSLDDATFTHFGVNYTVTQFFVNPDSLYAIFATSPNLPAAAAGLTLSVQQVSGQRDIPLAGKDYSTTPFLPGTTKGWQLGNALNSSGADPLATPLLHGPDINYNPYHHHTDKDTDVTIWLTFANRAATGAPTISGTAQVGETLTAAISDIADADGLPTTFPGDYTIQWLRVDADGVSNQTPIGTNSTTYTPVAGDAGKKIKVQLTFTDGGGTSETLSSAAYPSSGTVTAAAAPTVSITADKTTAVYREDSITYTLTRTGSTTAALPVSVTLTQTKDFLDTSELTKTVTIPAGQTTGTFTIAAFTFQHFAAGTAVEAGTLTAAVQDGTDYDLGTPSSVDVNVVIGPMIQIENASYSVNEADGALIVQLIARTGPGAPQPTTNSSSVDMDFENVTAIENTDYETIQGATLTLGIIGNSWHGLWVQLGL